MAYLPTVQDDSNTLHSPDDSKATPLVHIEQIFSSETPDEPPKSAFTFTTFLYWAFIILGNLWLAPAIALLVLNFKGHIVGRSLGCRGAASCHLNRFDFDLSARTQALDKQDHNILGALQLVAKVLDTWFMMVATSLAYHVTLCLASRRKGLQISLLAKHLEYEEMGFIMNVITEYIMPLLHGWTSRTSARQKHISWLTYVFIAFLLCLSVLVNLMGPATAVLAIPTLQWIDRESEKAFIFNEIASSTSPRDVDHFWSVCTTENLKSGEFSCLRRLYGASLDASIANNRETNRQSIPPHGRILPSVFQELGVTCSVNLTESNKIQWIPNRKVLRDLSVDYSLYANMSSSESFDAPDYHDYSALNSSLRARLQRHGPVVGVETQCFNSTPTIFNISQDQSIRCYDETLWMNSSNPTPTAKCIAWGSGWNVAQAHARFSAPDFLTERQYNVSVEIFMTGRVVEIDRNTRPSCFVNGLIDFSSECDWQEIFFDNRNAPSSMRQQTFEYHVPSKPNTFTWCYATYTFGFATYVLNPSSQNNLLNLVQLEVWNEDITEHLEVHPDWILAGWAVNRNGVVSKDRASARALVDSLLGTFEDGGRLNIMDFYGVHLSSVSHAVSLISYSHIDPANSPQDNTDEVRHPKLRVWASGQLWKFGLGTRMSKLGVTVVIAGTIVVLLRIYCYRWGVPSPLELVVDVNRCRYGQENDRDLRHAWSTAEYQFGQVGDRFCHDWRRENNQSLRRRNWSSGTNTFIMDEVS